MKLETLTPSEISQKKSEVVYGVKSNESMIVQDVDLTKRIVTGFYNTCFYFDADWDVSLPGCNNKSIMERGPDSTAPAKIKHLANHNWSTIPGKLQVLEEKLLNFKGRSVPGTYFETKMTKTQLGTDTLINYQEGLYDNHSFGFKYMDIEMIDKESIDWNRYRDQLINPEDADKVGLMFLVKEYKMFEGSNVGLGANSLTPYMGVKSGNKQAILIKINERFNTLTKQLKSGTQSDETMQQFEMEILQLQQITKELFDEEPSIKDTLLQQHKKESDAVDEKEIPSLSETIKTIKFFN